LVVNKETKKFNLNPIFPCRLSWDYSMKDKYNLIIQNWQITFQASDFKGNHFLELLDNDYLPIKPVYTKNGMWLKSIGHSNFLYMRATRVIMNHAPIEEYCLRFFLKESFCCPYAYYPIESRCHMIHECRRYNNYWNPNRKSF